MKAKHLVIGFVMLGIVLACNLPSPPYNYISSAIDCAFQGGDFFPPEVIEETGRIIPEYCIVGEEEVFYYHPPEELQVEEPQVENQQEQSPQNENPQQESVAEAEGSFFSLADCQCGVPLPLNEGLSSASQNPHPYTSGGGLQVEEAQTLTCDWSEGYTSERVTGELSAHFHMVKFTQAEDAQTLYKEFKDEIEEQPQYCSEDRECTIAEEFFNDHRAWYVEKYTFIRGDGVQFPSSHYGYWAGVHTEAPDHFYAWMLYVSHPELDLGGTWVEDMTKAVEECTIRVIVR